MDINSRANSTFKNLLKLTQKKHRREQGLCIIEGEKIVRENLTHATAVFERGKSLSSALFDEVSSLETSQGILAVVPIPKPADITFPYLVLDGVQDPGNMGTLLRTACAFGFNTVFCINCADAWSQKVLRAGVGTQFALNIYELNFDQFLQMRQKELHDSNIFAACLDGDDLGNITTSGKFGIVLGSEGRGVSGEMLEISDKKVTIPINNGAESLNVAVAGGIIMHEWSQQMVPNKEGKGCK